MPTGTEGEWKIRRLAVAGQGKHRWGTSPLHSRPSAFHLGQAPYPTQAQPTASQGTAAADSAPSSLSGSWLPES